MPVLVRALTRFALIRLKTKRNKKISEKNFTEKTQYINLKAPSNNVKTQSDKSLTTQIYFFLTTKQMGILLNGAR